MNIFDTITRLFSGERVSHTDTFILAGLVRNISSQIEMPEVMQSRQNILKSRVDCYAQKNGDGKILTFPCWHVFYPELMRFVSFLLWPSRNST